MIEESDQTEEPTDENLDKLKRLEIERDLLLSNVLSGNLLTTKEKVGFILNRFSDARNSDIELAWQYWRTFELDKFNGIAVTKDQLFALTRMTSLVRSRAKIQNEYKLFEADDEVKEYRGVLEEENRQEAVDDKPHGMPGYTVFIDETGKTQNYLSVGSLWLVDELGPDTYFIKNEIDKWKTASGIDYEFHFAEVTRAKLEGFKSFFIRFVSLNPTAGFKIISIRRTGFRDLSQPITDLTFHLLDKGVRHENSTGRAPLPRTLQVWLDKDEEGTDLLKLENVRERLKAQNVDGLYPERFYAVDSKENYYVQAADLFTGAVNRMINPVSTGRNHKDELAEFILNITNFDLSQMDYNNDQIDNAAVFNLSDFA